MNEVWIYIVQCEDEMIAIDTEPLKEENPNIDLSFFEEYPPKKLLGVYKLTERVNRVYMRTKNNVSNKNVLNLIENHYLNLNNSSFFKRIPNCYCGYPASVKISQTSKNCGKIFYSCRLSNLFPRNSPETIFYRGYNIKCGEKCSFLEWTFKFS